MLVLLGLPTAVLSDAKPSKAIPSGSGMVRNHKMASVSDASKYFGKN